VAFGRDVFPEEKGRCSDASNKHGKRGDPGAFISVFLPDMLGKCANALFLTTLTSPQFVTHSLSPRQGLGNWMGKLRHRAASQDGLPGVQNSFAQPTPTIGTPLLCTGAGAARGGRYPYGDPQQRGCPSAGHPDGSQSALVLGQRPVRAGASPHIIHGIGTRAVPVTGGRLGPTRRVC